MTDKTEIGSVTRKTAKSGKIDYSQAVVIHESSRTRITALVFYIPHTDHTEVSLKIQSYTKSSLQWVLKDEKSITLDEPASRKLLQVMQTHFAVAERGESGEYILLRVSDGAAQLGDHHPETVAKALTRLLAQEDIVQHLAGLELTAELTSAIRASIRLSEMRSAVADLKQHLDNNLTSESVFQEWCEKHSWAFGNAFVMRDSVRSITTGDKLDLLLPTVIAGYRDIVELKRPDNAVINYDSAHKNHYFSAEVSKAIGQCHRYLDMLHRHAEHGLVDNPEVVAYHPRAIIVVGRSYDWSQEQHRALHGLNRRLSGITVMTYDHLLAQGERLLEIVGRPAEVEADPYLDDIPF